MRYPVELDPRHLKALSAPLLTGIVELIWNSIDADATEIEVRLRKNSLLGIDEIHVVDNGHGIDLSTAMEGFTGLGRSWKAELRRSRTLSRPLHGRRGRGRFRLFRHGGSARWESVADVSGQLRQIRITIRDGERDIEIDDLGETTLEPGTRVVLAGFGEAPLGLGGQRAVDRLLAIFALPIEEHEIRLEYDGKLLNPAEVLAGRNELEVNAGRLGELRLTVMQWSRPIGQQDLYLCDSGGAVLNKAPTRIIAPGLHFTAYLRWDGFGDQLGNLEVPDLDAGDMGAVVSAGRRRLERHFDNLKALKQRRVISDWKSEGVYPFVGPPADEHERTARQTFDVIALEAAETVNKSPKPGKRLSLRLLREALEHDPSHVHQILGDVLALPRENVAELSQLLRRTGLVQIISSSRSIADRLDFLHALGRLTAAPEFIDAVGEREHLHRILATETWVFGEEYALTSSERGLTEVLKQHIDQLGRTSLAGPPVRDALGRLRRVDMMFSALVPHADNVREHLVVELKRPGVSIGPRELEQVENYAATVAQDSRFDVQRTRWEFWAVSTSVTGSADRRRRERHRPFGLAYDDGDANIRVWVKTWAEIIHDAEHRLKYVKSKLGVDPDERTALEYLQRVHSEKLPDDAVRTSEVA